ncbi:cold-shock protein [Bacteroidota bacterium]
MTKGKVKWYNETKGYGFIETDNSDDVFVHRSGLDTSIRALEPDQEVEFEIKQGDKGLMAVDVKPVD